MLAGRVLRIHARAHARALSLSSLDVSVLRARSDTPALALTPTTGQEICTDADRFQIDFYEGSTGEEKANTIGLALLADYMYFEHDNGAALVLALGPATPTPTPTRTQTPSRHDLVRARWRRACHQVHVLSHRLLRRHRAVRLRPQAVRGGRRWLRRCRRAELPGDAALTLER